MFFQFSSFYIHVIFILCLFFSLSSSHYSLSSPPSLQITVRRQWKHVYDELGGNPSSTSAATCTRRHYERWVIIFCGYIWHIIVTHAHVEQFVCKLPHSCLQYDFAMLDTTRQLLTCMKMSAWRYCANRSSLSLTALIVWNPFPMDLNQFMGRWGSIIFLGLIDYFLWHYGTNYAVNSTHASPEAGRRGFLKTLNDSKVLNY